MKTRIHVNQHVIRRNLSVTDPSQHEPPITVKDYKSNRYASNVSIRDSEGNEVARVVYSPDKPLSCGARVWIETELAVEEGY